MPLFSVEKYIGSPRKYLYLLKENYYIQFGNINYPHKRPINGKISERSDGIVIMPLDLDDSSDNNNNLINDKINEYLYQGIPVLIPDKYKSWDIYYPLYYSKYSEIYDILIKNTELILKTHYYIKNKFNLLNLSEKTDKTNLDENTIIKSTPTPRKHNLISNKNYEKDQIINFQNINNVREFRIVCESQLEYIKQFSVNFLDDYSSKKPVVCFIEFDRKFEHLEFLIRNAILKFGNNWSYSVVCGLWNYEYYLNMINNAIGLSNAINIIKYPIKECSPNIYNKILCSTQFWDMIPNEKILIHQEDAFIFHGEYHQFMEYDYIGAPWSRYNNDNTEGVGNGGFSLRSKSIMLKVLECISPNDIKLNSSTKNYMKNKNLKLPPEDVYFSKSILDFNLGKVACRETAQKFSIETIYEENALGGHQFWMSTTNDNNNMCFIRKMFDSILTLTTTFNKINNTNINKINYMKFSKDIRWKYILNHSSLHYTPLEKYYKVLKNNCNNLDITYDLVVNLHFVNSKLLNEMIGYIKNCISALNRNRVLIIITIIDEKIVRDFDCLNDSNLIILAIENKGFDMGGFVLGNYYIRKHKINYKYQLKLHTKTNHLWRHEMCQHLIGSKENVENSIFKMDNDSLDILGSGTHYIPLDNINVDIIKHIIKIQKLDDLYKDSNKKRFLAGCIMFLSKQRIDNLFENIFSMYNYHIFEEEYSNNARGNSIIHALERLI
jgi:hypothetical protein